MKNIITWLVFFAAMWGMIYGFTVYQEDFSKIQLIQDTAQLPLSKEWATGPGLPDESVLSNGAYIGGWVSVDIAYRNSGK